MNGKPDKAIESYQKGLDDFPNSGKLYFELGNMQHDDLNKALEFYEKGIEVAPQYPSNYYAATKIFCNSTEEMWGMLYGELFINIERGSKRTEEISKLLFDTYFSEIQFTSDTSMTVSFCQNIVITDSKKKSLPFSMIYEPGLLFAITISDTITLASLNKIRENYISFYYERKFNKSHPNIVFDWHKTLIEKEQFECYNYWLLMKGSTDEFNAWHVSNKERFDDFINWFSENPMVIDDKNKFHRFIY
jgi:tetratricopeptide (TPR) repeat protein